ncbi:MAG: cell division topological specificity factor MinE [Eubacteriales bacterium]
MSWSFGGKKKSSQVAKDRLKLVLIYDRQGTTTNDDMIQLMKKDLLAVISKYVEIDETEFRIDLTSQMGEEGISSKLTADIPIKKMKQMVKNTTSKY